MCGNTGAPPQTMLGTGNAADASTAFKRERAFKDIVLVVITVLAGKVDNLNIAPEIKLLHPCPVLENPSIQFARPGRPV
jgi:hypothetical protein